MTLKETNYDWLFNMSVKQPHGRALANESGHLLTSEGLATRDYMRLYSEYRQFTTNPEGGAHSNAKLLDNHQQKNSECRVLHAWKQSPQTVTMCWFWTHLPHRLTKEYTLKACALNCFRNQAFVLVYHTSLIRHKSKYSLFPYLRCNVSKC